MEKEQCSRGGVSALPKCSGTPEREKLNLNLGGGSLLQVPPGLLFFYLKHTKITSGTFSYQKLF